MNAFQHHHRFQLGILCLLLLQGCSSDVARVTGQVEYEDGSPIEGAIRVIRFVPADDSNAVLKKVASSRIADDGSFELMTKRPGDGVYKGKYQVTFTVLESPDADVSLIMPQYTTPAATPLEAIVESSEEQFHFKLEKP